MRKARALGESVPNDRAFIAERHGIEDRRDTIAKMSGALDKLTSAALAED